MEQPTDLDDKEFTELYSRIERTYNIGKNCGG